MDIRNTQLHPSQYFHIFNRGINGQNVFLESKNYDYFLQKYIQFVDPFVNTYAYCLMKNHFHLLIQVKEEEELDLRIEKNKDKPYYWHVSNAFSSWLKSYTRSMNNLYKRTGALFEEPFKRIAVTNDAYFSELVAYIHYNPQKHGFVTDYRDYAYSSYQSYLTEKPTRLQKTEVLSWFGSWEDYQRFHSENYRFNTSISDLVIE